MTSLEQLKELEKESQLIQSVSAILNWDQQCMLPSQGNAYRGQQLAWLAKTNHQKMTSDKRKALLEELEYQKDSFNLEDQRLLTLVRRCYDENCKLPEKLVSALSEETSKAQTLWMEARKKNDESIFLPQLKKIIELTRERAKCLGYDSKNLYNNLLSRFNWGLTCDELDLTFGRLREALPKLAEKITAAGKFRDHLEGIKVPVPVQEKLGYACLDLMGFDRNKCRLDIAAHPFSITLGQGDYRITTRYDENNFTSSLLSTAHEMGHSLYEQGLPENLQGLPIGGYCSLGIHESQSLFWEKKVTTSKAFLEKLWPSFQETLKGHNSSVDLDQLYHSINHVKNSLIRVDSDEVTYGLHIVIRYEMEKLIINEGLPVEEIRSTWDKKYKEYLHIDVPDATNSFLQDVHWSWGEFGYFPSYAMGHIISSQLEQKMVQKLAPVEDLISQDRIPEILSWLRTNVHQEASKQDPSDLLKKITGEGLNPEPFLNYLEKKFLA